LTELSDILAQTQSCQKNWQEMAIGQKQVSLWRGIIGTNFVSFQDPLWKDR
jgi:hypothetical protein